MGLGFRLKVDFEFSGYPGIGVYFGTQGSSIQPNRFLGGFFKEVRMPETGIYLFHQVPVFKDLTLRGELGYGQLQVIHGLSPSRFILDFAHFSGGLVANYTLAMEVLGIFDLNLIVGGNYGFLNGNKIVTLPAGNQKGINIITWGFNTKNPKVATGKTLSYGGFTSPRVPEGIYKAVLTKGKETFTQEFKVVNDPKSVISSAERKKQAEATKMLFDKNEELAYMVYELDAMIALNKKIIEGDPKTAKANNKIDAEFNALKNTMVVTTGDMYVGAAEPQLREKLTAIYSTVASQFDAPSPSQLANIESVMDSFNTTKSTFTNLKSKYKNKLIEQAAKLQIPFSLKSFEEYLKD
jgi:hypothetical protein